MSSKSIIVHYIKLIYGQSFQCSWQGTFYQTKKSFNTLFQKALNIIILNFYKNESNPLKWFSLVISFNFHRKLYKEKFKKNKELEEDHRLITDSKAANSKQKKSFNKLFLKCIQYYIIKAPIKMKNDLSKVILIGYFF